MKLDNINPEIIKTKNNNELEELSADIRRFLVESISKTGGHLASNLGVVELTIALHHEFDSPSDKFIFDVGHQGYVHKIITGRSEQFDHLRQRNGLSGYLKRSESEHDVWEAGHSSTSISAAVGFAIANPDDYSIAIIGDGALTGGMAYEALNHIGEIELDNIIIILNDNNMSITKPIGGISKYLLNLRTTDQYEKVRSSAAQSFSGKLGAIAKITKDRLKDNVLPKEGLAFENMYNINYIGPIDGHNFSDLFAAIKLAKKRKGPTLIHTHTVKGKGFKYAENDYDGIWHGIGKYDPYTGDVISSESQKITWSEVVSKAVEYNMEVDDKIQVITPAMIAGSKLKKIDEKYPTRLHDVGIAEEHALTMASGMAQGGLKPFVTIYSSFLQRGYDQIHHDIARMNSPVIIGVDRAGIVGEDGSTHQGIYDIGFLKTIPNMTIMQAKDSNEMQDLIYTAFNLNSPVAIRYPRAVTMYNQKSPQLIKLGDWSIECPGKHLTIISYGQQLKHAIKVATQLSIETRKSVQVINARFIRPMDEKLLLEVLSKKKHDVLVVEEVIQEGSLYQDIVMFANKNNLPAKIHSLSLPNDYIRHGTIQEVVAEYKLDKNGIKEEAQRLLKKKRWFIFKWLKND